MLLALNRPRVRILLRSMTIPPSRDVKDQLLEIIDASVRVIEPRCHRDFPRINYRANLGTRVSRCTINCFSCIFFLRIFSNSVRQGERVFSSKV